MSSGKTWLASVLVALSWPAAAAEDLRALEVKGERGKSAGETRRDRYECHNWAVGETGEAPAAVPAAEPRDGEPGRRGERIERAIAGAALGGVIGSIFGNGRRRDSSDRALAGAAVGAAIGAATAGGGARNGADPATEEPSDYLRALTACLEGRGYSVSMPAVAETTASR